MLLLADDDKVERRQRECAEGAGKREEGRGETHHASSARAPRTARRHPGSLSSRCYRGKKGVSLVAQRRENVAAKKVNMKMTTTRGKGTHSM